MKKSIGILVLGLVSIGSVCGQHITPKNSSETAIIALIDQYSLARDKNDTILLKEILTPDVDQLVSNGEWRKGVGAAVEGMLRSSGSNPGSRKLHVAGIRMFNSEAAIADCRYETPNSDGSVRKMWSSFIVVREKARWKISAIRNMLPSPQ
jgi:hypothetical protein